MNARQKAKKYKKMLNELRVAWWQMNDVHMNFVSKTDQSIVTVRSEITLNRDEMIYVNTRPDIYEELIHILAKSDEFKQLLLFELVADVFSGQDTYRATLKALKPDIGKEE